MAWQNERLEQSAIDLILYIPNYEQVKAYIANEIGLNAKNSNSFDDRKHLFVRCKFFPFEIP